MGILDAGSPGSGCAGVDRELTDLISVGKAANVSHQWTTSLLLGRATTHCPWATPRTTIRACCCCSSTSRASRCRLPRGRARSQRRRNSTLSCTTPESSSAWVSCFHCSLTPNLNGRMSFSWPGPFALVVLREALFPADQTQVFEGDHTLYQRIANSPQRQHSV